MTKHLIQVIYPDEFHQVFHLDLPFEDAPNVWAVLEEVFGQWNDSPFQSQLSKESRVRSMSVNDFVSVNGVFYQCQSIGWTEVTPEYVSEIIKEVRSHPFRKEHGAWISLNDVMYDRRKAKQSCKCCGKQFVPEYGEYARCKDCFSKQISDAEIAAGVE
jgi:hypothetical protein